LYINTTFQVSQGSAATDLRLGETSSYSTVPC